MLYVFAHVVDAELFEYDPFAHFNVHFQDVDYFVFQIDVIEYTIVASHPADLVLVFY